MIYMSDDHNIHYRDVFDTTLCDKVCWWLAAGQWFSPGTLVSSTNKTELHDITVEIHQHFFPILLVSFLSFLLQLWWSVEIKSIIFIHI
jgi:hypothetical protein